VNRIWVSVYTPQIGESSPEILMPAERETLARELPELATRYPKLLFNKGLAKALLNPPANPQDCVFSKMSANYSADLRSRVEPCVFGGTPDCSQCGCAISSGLHWIRTEKVVGPLKVGHFIQGSIKIGRLMNRFRPSAPDPARWQAQPIPVDPEPTSAQD
jgi:hypothetical protein